jgi:hypothetical protein
VIVCAAPNRLRRQVGANAALSLRAATTFTPHARTPYPICGGDKAGIAQIATHNDRISLK